MKLSPYVSELSLYDVVNTPGVAVDLSHINTASKVRGYVGAAQLGDALTGCQLVIIPAGRQFRHAHVLRRTRSTSKHVLPQPKKHPAPQQS